MTTTTAGVRQRNSHAALVYDAMNAPTPPPSSRACRIDAIVVPASRGMAVLRSSIRLSLELSARLVVLCSQKTRARDVAGVVATYQGCRALVIDVPKGYTHPILPAATAAHVFRKASADRQNDLSLKRNLGLLLARLHGWSKILFLDDDITYSPIGETHGIGPRTARRLAALLDRHQMAGMVCKQFPDNSVVCHARRLSGLPQDNYISGAALGVNCSDQPLPFFPDIYNEDWFFFSRLAARRELAKVGEATQASYDPYEDPLRARQEEFGDLLAEGLYALFEGQPPETAFADRLAGATEPFWEGFIEGRANSIDETYERLTRHFGAASGARQKEFGAAFACLEAAGEQLGRLTPNLCAAYLEAWQSDLAYWERGSQRVNAVSGSTEALNLLGLTGWQAHDHEGAFLPAEVA